MSNFAFHRFEQTRIASKFKVHGFFASTNAFYCRGAVGVYLHYKNTKHFVDSKKNTYF